MNEGLTPLCPLTGLDHGFRVIPATRPDRDGWQVFWGHCPVCAVWTTGMMRFKRALTEAEA